MFGAMIFNSLSLLSLLTVAITLTVLGFYGWAGVFYALSLLMLTKVGVDTTKEIRTEIKNSKKTSTAMSSSTTSNGASDGGQMMEAAEEKADFSWQRLE